MYRCQRCGSDVTAEAEAEISYIVSGSPPGHTCAGLMNYFERHYVCKACEEHERAAKAVGKKKK